MSRETQGLEILSLHMNGSNGSEVYIDVQEETIGFIVVNKKEGKQYDFVFTDSEWNLIKSFIELQSKTIKNE